MITRLIFLLYISFNIHFNVLSQETSFKNSLSNARTLDNIAINQIDRLKSVVREIEKTSHVDTLALAYYYLAARYVQVLQPPNLDSAIIYSNKALYNFNLSSYTAYQKQRSLNYLLHSLDGLGQYTNAIKAYRKYSGSYLIDDSNLKAESQIVSKIATSYRKIGEKKGGMSVVNTFLKNHTLTNLPPQNFSDLYLQKSFLEYDLELYQDALNSVETAIKYQNELQKINSDKNRFDLINQQALILSAMSKKEEAQRVYEKSLSKQLSKIDQFVFLSNAYNNLESMKAYIIAAPYAKKAYELSRQLEISAFNTYVAKLHYSESLRHLNELDSAMYIGEKGIKFLTDNQTQDAGLVRPLIKTYHNQILNHIKFAKIKDRINFIDSACSYMNAIDSLVPTYLNNLLFEGSLLQNKQEIAQWYDTGVELAFIKKSPELLIQYSDKTKSLSFLSKSDLSTEMRELIRQESQLEMQLTIDSTSQDSLTTLLLDNREKQRIILTNQKSNSLISMQKGILDNSIEDDISILYYHKTDTVYYACHMTSNFKKIFKLGLVEELSNSTNSFNQHIRNKEFDENPSNFLYNVLVKPLGKLNQRVVVIPDQELSLIPFESLVMEDGTYMIENHEISYALSFNQYINSERTSSTNIENFYVVSPDYNEDYIVDLSTTKGIANLGDQFSFLEHTKQEVEYLKNELDANTIEGFDITKDGFFEAFTQANIFHFTGHAVSLIGNDNLSFLALGESGDKVDQDVFIREIAEYPTNASLVMLNACNTGSGRILKGEGVYNLARSFFKAGAKSVVSGLWEIDDYASGEITKSFYKYLKEGKRKSKALQLAKLDYLNSANTDQQRNPYYWAGLILTGNNDSVFSSYRRSIYLLGFLMIAVILLFLKRKTILKAA